MHLTHHALTETYIDVENWLRKIVGDFHRSHGGEFQDLMQEASVVYLQIMGCDSTRPNGRWNPTHSSLTNWLYVKVRSALMNLARAHARKGEKLTRCDADLDEIPQRCGFNDRLSALSTDAVYLVVIAQRHCKHMEPDDAQNLMWQRSRESGWTWQRFEHAFTEVSEVLA